MLPKENAGPRSCEVKTALLVTYQSAASLYSRVVSDLARQTGNSSFFEYERLRTKAEKARKLSIAARNDLDVHTFEHGC
jgi:hypothetical protein